MIDCERQLNTAEAALCEAAHQLKGALKAASQTDEIKRVLDSVQKKYLLLGEVINSLSICYQSISARTETASDKS